MSNDRENVAQSKRRANDARPKTSYPRLLLVLLLFVHYADRTTFGAARPSATDESNWCGKPLFDYSVGRLTHGEAEQRRIAVQLIRGFARSGKCAVPALVRAVDDPDSVVRLLAVVALGEIGPAASAAVPVLMEKLDDERYLAGNTLNGYVFRPDPAPVSTALARIGEASVSSLLKVLRDGNAQARCRAATGFAQMKPPPIIAIPELVNALRDKESFVRSESAKALGRIGPGARDAIPALETALDDHEFFSGDYKVIVVALTRLGAPPVAVLERAIRDEQTSYFESLSLIGAHGKSAIPALVNALKNDNPDVRVHAFNAICHFGATAEPALPALLYYLKAKDTIDSFEAAALAQMCEAARQVVPLLMKMLPNLDKETAVEVIRILAEIDPAGTESLPTLLTLLKSPDSPLRKEICATLSYIGPAASASVPSLIEIAKTPQDEAQDAAINALGRIGPGAAAAVPALIELATDNDSVALESIIALGRIGPASGAAVPRLIRFVNSDGCEIQRAAARALGQIGQAAAASIPVLMDHLKDPKGIVAEAAMALVRIDPKTRGIVERMVDEVMPQVSRSEDPERQGTSIVIVAAALGKECPQLQSFVDWVIDDIEAELFTDGEYPSDFFPRVVRDHLDLLADLGNGARAGVPRLLGLLKCKHPLIQRWVRERILAVSR
jgi:HEAT repeat protein